MRQGTRQQTILGLVAGLGSALAILFLFHWPVWIAGAVSLLAYTGTYLLTRPRMKIGQLVIDDLPAGDALRTMLLDAKDDMDALQRASSEIHEGKVRKNVEDLYKIGTHILDYLQKHPSQITQARRFFTYYLSTARMLAERYISLQETGIQTEDLERVRAQTEHALDILRKAFEGQYEKLMTNDLLDMEQDIEVLKANLKIEGIEI